VRALAVAAVVLYHGGVAATPGGFLGVDVFFVLSGYLITSLLLAERRATGSVDLAAFWARRARRLLPAVVVLLAVTLAVVAVGFAADLGQTRGNALASLLYVQNWHLILADTSYFEGFARPSPLLHLWSLSIEEQFYLVFPPLLGAGLVALGRGRMAACTAAAAVVSAVLMALLFGAGSDPSRVYFGTDTRAATLLVGALLAFAWPPAREGAHTGRGAGIVLDVAAGLALAVLALLIVRAHDYESWLYRGGFLVVAVTSALLIAAVVHPACRVAALLASRPLLWVGRRSYGIYLWHWPVMVFTRPGIDVAWSRWILVPLQIAATVALAAASYRFVERPFRTGQAGRLLAAWLDARAPRERLAAVGAAAALVAAAIGLVAGTPVPSQASAPLRQERSVAATQAPGDAGRAEGRPAPRAGGPALAVGASVMLAAADAVQRRLGPKTRVDAAVGRQTDEVTARLRAYRAAGRLPVRVVVQVGENGPLSSGELGRLRDALRGVARVVFVTVRIPRSWESQVNGALARAVASWPGARLADWHGASGAAGLLYDGAHPDPAGQELYARVVARAVCGRDVCRRASAATTRPSGTPARTPRPAAGTTADRR
jgi:peptidoglycan/LPS O-acetylase OafA/YrhL